MQLQTALQTDIYHCENLLSWIYLMSKIHVQFKILIL